MAHVEEACFLKPEECNMPRILWLIMVCAGSLCGLGQIAQSAETGTDAKLGGSTQREIHLAGGDLTCCLLDNIANAGRSGLNPLFHSSYPEKAIFRTEFVGLNFEHIFNGAAANRSLCMFTPRKDACGLVPLSPNSASLRWPADLSAWKIGCEMTYSLGDPSVVDMTFSATPTVDLFPLGYVAFMWASYMNRTRERRIHFRGRDGDREAWISFGDDIEGGFETGAVSFVGVPALPCEEGAQTLNVLEHPTKEFLKPFYYGLIDGDNDLQTADDTLAYIMMFDQSESIRFALWNFIKDEGGNSDAHSPAWDWQFVVRNPQVGRTYGYRARLVIKAFEGPEDVEREYEAWRARR
jgi:hypothetical protein